MHLSTRQSYSLQLVFIQGFRLDGAYLCIGEIVDEPLNGEIAICGGDARLDAESKEACRITPRENHHNNCRSCLKAIIRRKEWEQFKQYFPAWR